jgi:hypothetical protein
MSAKKQLSPHILVSAASLAASFNSPAQQIQYTDNIGIEVDVTGASGLSGIFAVQVSASFSQDDFGNILNAGTWITLMDPSGTPIEATVVGNGAVYFDLNQLSAPWVRISYIATTGTGTATILTTAKGL